MSEDKTTFSVVEIAVILSAVNLKDDNSARTFEAIKLPDVASLMKKLKALADEDGNIQPGDYALNLTTDEKVLVKDCLGGRTWPSGDAEAVLSLTEKLK